MSISKLIIGTAGLSGQPYGRQKRIVDRAEAKAVLQEAYHFGIRTFDVAPAYGFAEEVVGDCFGTSNNVTIFSRNTGDREQAFNSIKLLGRPIFLVHNWDKNFPAIPKWCNGVTTYQESVLDAGNSNFEWIQFNWHLLAQTPFPKYGKVIARSVFLQGVLAGEDPPPGVDLKAAHEMAALFKTDLPTLALRAALENPRIHSVLVGPTSIQELQGVIKMANAEELGINRFLPLIDMDDRAIIDPRRFG